MDDDLLKMFGSGAPVYRLGFYRPQLMEHASNAEAHLVAERTPERMYVRAEVLRDGGNEHGAQAYLQEAAWRVPCVVGRPLPGDRCTCCGKRLVREGVVVVGYAFSVVCLRAGWSKVPEDVFRAVAHAPGALELPRVRTAQQVYGHLRSNRRGRE